MATWNPRIQPYPCCVQFLAYNNFYVLIDDHSEDPTVQNDPNQWVLYWSQLMTDIQKDPRTRNRVMVDLLNEPDHASYSWAQVGFLRLTSLWDDTFFLTKFQLMLQDIAFEGHARRAVRPVSVLLCCD